jgi:carboxylesterase
MAKKLPPVSIDGYRLAGDGPLVILFHGYTGSPYDLKPLALYLNKQGCEVNVPLLYGHGTKSSDLVGITSDDWIVQAKLELTNVDKNRTLVLGGLSMGALIAILMAPASNAGALILLSPALHLTFGAELAITGGKLGILSPDQSIPKIGGKSDIADPIAKKKCPSYPDMPLFGLMQLSKLCHEAREQLSNVQCPVFSAFGQQDGAIDTSASHQTILANVKGLIISKVYARSKHVVSLDYDRDILASDVWHFLTTYLRS